MATNIRQVEFLARAIVNRLEDRGLVEFGDAEIGIQIVTRTLEENFQAYDSIEQEARALGLDVRVCDEDRHAVGSCEALGRERD